MCLRTDRSEIDSITTFFLGAPAASGVSSNKLWYKRHSRLGPPSLPHAATYFLNVLNNPSHIARATPRAHLCMILPSQAWKKQNGGSSRELAAMVLFMGRSSKAPHGHIVEGNLFWVGRVDIFSSWVRFRIYSYNMNYIYYVLCKKISNKLIFGSGIITYYYQGTDHLQILIVSCQLMIKKL